MKSLLPCLAAMMIVTTIHAENVGFYSASRQAAGPDAWDLPGDVPEMMRRCQDIPALYAFSRNGYLSIECGYQAILFNGDVPIANAPHIPWMKPLAKPPKLLVFAKFGNSPADYAQVAQLCREFDASTRFVLIASAPVNHEVLKDEAYRLGFLAEQAREALKDDYDAIVFAMGSYSPGFGHKLVTEIFPTDVYESVLAKVREGTGLVLVGSNMGGWWVNDTPLLEASPATMTGKFWRLSEESNIRPVADQPLFAGLPTHDLREFALYDWQLKEGATVLATESDRPCIIGGAYGRGRVLLLGYDGTLAPVRTMLDDTLAFEHGLALAIRGVAWAANAAPPVQVVPRDADITAGQPGAVDLNLSADVRLDASLRSRDNRLVWQAVVESTAGAGNLMLPPLPSGSYALHLIARDTDGNSLGFGGCAVTVTGTRQLTVAVTPELAAIGDTVTVSASLTEDDARQVIPATRFEIAIRDVTGRLLAIGQTNPFAYAVADARVAPHVAEVTVYEDDRPVLRQAASFFVPDFTWTDYENVLWPTTPVEMNLLMRDRGGMTAVMDSWGRSTMGEAGARVGIRAARMNDGIVEPKKMVTDPAAGLVQYDYVINPAIEAARKHGALTWAFQDERHGGDPGMPGEAGLTAFRDYLKEIYGSLDALNAQWETDYASWETVLPMMTADITAHTTNLSPWVDLRLFGAENGYRTDKRHAEMVRNAFGPDVSIGIDGFTTSGHVIPYGAIDIGRMLTTGVFNSYCPYGDDLMIASMVTGPMVRYLGWGMSRKDYFGQPWRDVFRGHWGTFRFFGQTFYSQFGWMQPSGDWTGEGTRELRSGTGRLLMGSKRQIDPVVILYSYPSMMTIAGAGAWVEKGNSHLMWRPANWSRDAWEQMLVGCGNSFGYLTEAQVQAGMLSDRRLLIIPHFMGIALGTETCRAIEQFVTEGGVVVADIVPAICDDHGKLLPKGNLDDLFGIRHDGFQYGQRPADYLVGVTNQDPQSPINGMNLGENGWYIGEWFEKTLQVTDGTALGKHWFTDIPAMVVKHTGKGQAILLNFLHTATVRRNGQPEDDEYKLMEQLLAFGRIEPQARVETDYGQRERFAEVNTLHDGLNSYVGVYANRTPDEDPARLILRFKDARETYDVRTGAYLGKVDQAPIPLRLKEAALFARLDYRVTALTLEAKSAVAGQPVQLTLRLATTTPPGRHIVHIGVSEPDGTPNFFYTRNVELVDGVWQGSLPTALSDRPGTWRIEAREVVSAMSASATFKLEARP